MDVSCFPLCSNTALRLSFEESINSHHSCWSCLIPRAFIRPSTSQQHTRSSSFLKKSSNCWWRLRNELIRTFSSRRFHSWSLDASNSALLLESSRWRARSFSPCCVRICGAEDSPWETFGLSVHALGSGKPEVSSPSSSSESTVNSFGGSGMENP